MDPRIKTTFIHLPVLALTYQQPPEMPLFQLNSISSKCMQATYRLIYKEIFELQAFKNLQGNAMNFQNTPVPISARKHALC